MPLLHKRYHKSMSSVFNKFTRIVFFLSFLFYAMALNAFNWVPKQSFINGQKEQTFFMEKIVKQEPILYCIDEEVLQEQKGLTIYIKTTASVREPEIDFDDVEIEYSFQMWFDNVLKRGKKYPDFANTFSDILPILKQPVKMKRVSCSSRLKDYGVGKFTTQKEDYKFNSEQEDLRFIFTSLETLNKVAAKLQVKDKVSGMFVSSPERTEIWIAKRGMFDERTTLLHELGHMLGFADVSYNEESKAKDYGSKSVKTIMAKDFSYLTCDDADGLVAMIYLALDEEKLFKSFCPDNIFYHNGKPLTMPDFTNVKELENRDLFSDMNKIFSSK